MKKLLSAAAVTGLLLAAAACSGADETKDGVTAKERSDLDNAAMMLDGNEIIDTSADSLVLEENAAEAAPPVANGTAPAETSANSVGQSPVQNEAAPR